jgi:plasmid stabilization system protein ParE
MIVRIAASAIRDLEEIGDYIAQDNPERALSFVRELRDACLGLASMPAAFPLVPRYEHLDVRFRVHRNYLIFYKVEIKQVVVVRILHGARNYAALLFEGDQPDW